jgi:hypothetical protein
VSRFTLQIPVRPDDTPGSLPFIFRLRSFRAVGPKKAARLAMALPRD